jgi:hypothetical protein
MNMATPRQQPLPSCHRHPRRKCPGECQYILGHEECLHDQYPGDPEGRARAINAEPWEPLPGMVKRRCEECDYWYASPAAQRTAICPDCVFLRRQGKSYVGRGNHSSAIAR